MAKENKIGGADTGKEYRRGKFDKKKKSSEIENNKRQGDLKEEEFKEIADKLVDTVMNSSGKSAQENPDPGIKQNNPNPEPLESAATQAVSKEKNEHQKASDDYIEILREEFGKRGHNEKDIQNFYRMSARKGGKGREFIYSIMQVKKEGGDLDEIIGNIKDYSRSYRIDKGRWVEKIKKTEAGKTDKDPEARLVRDITKQPKEIIPEGEPEKTVEVLPEAEGKKLDIGETNGAEPINEPVLAEENIAEKPIPEVIEKNESTKPIEPKSNRLDEINARVSVLRQEQAKLAESLKKAKEDLAKKTAENSGFVSKFKNLFGNISLGNAQKEEETLKAEYDEILKKVGSIGGGISDLEKQLADLKKTEPEEKPEGESAEAKAETAEAPVPEPKVKEAPKEPENKPEKVAPAVQESVFANDEEKLVYGGFEKDFSIKKEELDKISGFSELSNGQKLLALENLKQITLGRIQEEASDKHKTVIKGSGLPGRIWQGISKQYQIAKLEKVTAQEIMKGGMNVHGKVLEQLTKGLKEFGPEAEIKNGEVKVKYVYGLGDLKPNQEKAVNEFNDAAYELSKMPYEWSLESAKLTEKRKYQRVRDHFDELRNKILKTKEAKSGDPVEAASYMSGIEGKILLDQFIASHPQVEKRLGNIKDGHIWKSVVKSVVKEKGIYFASGFSGKWYFGSSVLSGKLLLAGTLGWTAAPFASGAMGGIMAGKRAKESLREKEKLSRRGVKDVSREAKDFEFAKKIEINKEGREIKFGLADKLESLVAKVGESNGEEERAALLRLKSRVNYTRRKISEGLIDFGTEENRLASQYELARALSMAKAEVEGQENNAKLESRLNKLLDDKKEKIAKEQKAYINKEIKKGIMIGMGCALAGATLREIISYFGTSGKVPLESGTTQPVKESAYAVGHRAGKVEVLAKRPWEAGNKPGTPRSALRPWETSKPEVLKNAPPVESAEKAPVVEKAPKTSPKIIDKEIIKPAGKTVAAGQAAETTSSPKTAPPVEHMKPVAEHKPMNFERVEIKKGKSVEGTLIDLLKEKGIENPGAKAHLIAEEFAKAHSDLFPKGAPDLVHPGTSIKLNINPADLNDIKISEINDSGGMGYFSDMENTRHVMKEVRSLIGEGKIERWHSLKGLKVRSILEEPTGGTERVYNKSMGALRKVYDLSKSKLGKEGEPLFNESVEKWTKRIAFAFARRGIKVEI